MAQLERTDLHGEIELRFQDNTNEEITPRDVRDFMHDLVDSALLAASDSLDLSKWVTLAQARAQLSLSPPALQAGQLHAITGAWNAVGNSTVYLLAISNRAFHPQGVLFAAGIYSLVTVDVVAGTAVAVGTYQPIPQDKWGLNDPPQLLATVNEALDYIKGRAATAPVNTTPTKPNWTYLSGPRTLSLAHATLAGAELEYSHDGGFTWLPYTGTLNIDNAEHVPGDYIGRVKAATGRNVSPIANSPAIAPVAVVITPPAAPTITSFTPTSGPAGSQVVITGTNFTSDSSVSVGSGLVASLNVVSATQIKATLTSGQLTGKLKVTTPAGTATSAADFTVTTGSAGTGTAQVRADGHSIVYGVPLATAVQPLADPAAPFGIVKVNLGSTNYKEWGSYAVGGNSIADRLSNVGATTAGLDSTCDTHILFFDATINSFLKQGLTGPQAYGDLKQYITAATTRGWRVIIKTVDWQDFNGTGASYSAASARLAGKVFNDLVKAGWRDDLGAWDMIDTTQDSHFGLNVVTVADPNIFQPDNLHLAAGGNTAMAAIIQPYIVAARNNQRLGVVTPNPGTGTAALVVEDVEWVDLIGTTASGNSLTMTSGTSYQTTGHSRRAIGAANDAVRGYAEFTLNPADGEGVVGLNETDTGADFSDIPWSFSYVPDLGIKPFGSAAGPTQPYVPYVAGDKPRLRVEAQKVVWLLNNTVLLSINSAPTGDLFVDTSFKAVGAKVSNVKIAGTNLVDYRKSVPTSPAAGFKASSTTPLTARTKFTTAGQSTASLLTFFVVVDKDPTATGTQFMLTLPDGAGAATDFYWESQRGFGLNTYTNDGATMVVDTTILDNGKVLLTLSIAPNSPAPTIRENGVAQTLNSFGTQVGRPFTDDLWLLGSFDSSALDFHGTIYEWYEYFGPLTPADRQQTEQYLVAKYSL